MKRTFHLFLALVFISGAFFLYSCKDKVASTGTLSVTAMNEKGVLALSSPTPIYLATSKQNMDNKIYVCTGWLDGNGSKIFRELLPGYYWYRIDGWDDCGAAEVYAGVDASVILWLYSPDSSKK